jgi:Flp pilus assembly pilin Flp
MLQIYWEWLRARLGALDDREAGLTSVEYVVLGAILVVGVATVAAILVAKLTDKANGINL